MMIVTTTPSIEGKKNRKVPRSDHGGGDSWREHIQRYVCGSKRLLLGDARPLMNANWGKAREIAFDDLEGLG